MGNTHNISIPPVQKIIQKADIANSITNGINHINTIENDLRNIAKNPVKSINGILDGADKARQSITHVIMPGLPITYEKGVSIVPDKPIQPPRKWPYKPPINRGPGRRKPPSPKPPSPHIPDVPIPPKQPRFYSYRFEKLLKRKTKRYSRK